MTAVRQKAKGRFDERGDQARGREEDADLSVAEIEVVTDKGESRGQRAEDELVPEFDREEDRPGATVEARQLRRVWHPPPGCAFLVPGASCALPLVTQNPVVGVAGVVGSADHADHRDHKVRQEGGLPLHAC